jgi:hypothetical protein
MRWGTTIVDHPESYPDHPPAVRTDDIDQLKAAVRELEAVVLHEQARHLAELHATLAELYQRDGVQIADAELEAQADELALLERGDRFLQDVATRLHPDGELLALARQLDDHGLRVWRQAAGSLVDDCPPSLVHLRWQAELRAELAECRRRRERSARRLAHLDAKLQVIDNTEHARAAWIAQAREMLVRGVAAAQVLAERQAQHRDGERDARPAWPAVLDDGGLPGAGS